MKTPDGSQNAHRQALAKLMKLVAALLGGMALFVPGAIKSKEFVEKGSEIYSERDVKKNRLNIRQQPIL
jgi:hypothetical protein